jgi:hypothetical protein
MKTRLSVAMLGFVALLGAGCTRLLDHEKIEQSIREEGEKKDWPMKSVACPPARGVKKGDKFDCKVSFDDGQTLNIPVEQTDELGSVKWHARGILSVRKLTASVTKQFAPEGVASCPRKDVIVAKKGDKIACTAETDGNKTEVEVSVVDDDGKIVMRAVTPQ